VRQLHDLHVGVVVDLWSAIVQWQDAIDSSHALDERDQLRLHPEVYLARDTSQLRRVSQVLHGVPEPVVAAHENALSLERLAIPDPLLVPGKMPAGDPGSGVQDPVTDFPRRGEVAAAHALDPIAGGGHPRLLGIVR
jgi:hypothetical protein